jgi:hypothetical protein
MTITPGVPPAFCISVSILCFNSAGVAAGTLVVELETEGPVGEPLDEVDGFVRVDEGSVAGAGAVAVVGAVSPTTTGGTVELAPSGIGTSSSTVVVTKVVLGASVVRRDLLVVVVRRLTFVVVGRTVAGTVVSALGCVGTTDDDAGSAVGIVGIVCGPGTSVG